MHSKPNHEGMSTTTAWRKYGQKVVGIRGRAVNRSYYRCSILHCPAKRKVDHEVNAPPGSKPLSVEDACDHNHEPLPLSADALEEIAASSGDSAEVVDPTTQVASSPVMVQDSTLSEALFHEDVNIFDGWMEQRAEDVAAAIYEDLTHHMKSSVRSKRNLETGGLVDDIIGCIDGGLSHDMSLEMLLSGAPADATVPEATSPSPRGPLVPTKSIASSIRATSANTPCTTSLPYTDMDEQLGLLEQQEAVAPVGTAPGCGTRGAKLSLHSEIEEGFHRWSFPKLNTYSEKSASQGLSSSFGQSLNASDQQLLPASQQQGLRQSLKPTAGSKFLPRRGCELGSSAGAVAETPPYFWNPQANENEVNALQAALLATATKAGGKARNHQLSESDRSQLGCFQGASGHDIISAVLSARAQEPWQHELNSGGQQRSLLPACHGNMGQQMGSFSTGRGDEDLSFPGGQQAFWKPQTLYSQSHRLSQATGDKGLDTFSSLAMAAKVWNQHSGRSSPDPGGLYRHLLGLSGHGFDPATRARDSEYGVAPASLGPAVGQQLLSPQRSLWPGGLGPKSLVHRKGLTTPDNLHAPYVDLPSGAQVGSNHFCELLSDLRSNKRQRIDGGTEGDFSVMEKLSVSAPTNFELSVRRNAQSLKPCFQNFQEPGGSQQMALKTRHGLDNGFATASLQEQSQFCSQFYDFALKFHRRGSECPPLSYGVPS